MAETPVFVLAYTRTDLNENSESNNQQRESIERYAIERGYTIVQYVEHFDRPGNAYDFEWLTKILEKDNKIKLILVDSLDRFCSDFRIAQKLIAFLELKYNIVFDTVLKMQTVSFDRVIVR